MGKANTCRIAANSRFNWEIRTPLLGFEPRRRVLTGYWQFSRLLPFAVRLKAAKRCTLESNQIPKRNTPGSNRVLLRSRFMQHNTSRGSWTLNSVSAMDAKQEKKEWNPHLWFWRPLCYHLHHSPISSDTDSNRDYRVTRPRFYHWTIRAEVHNEIRTHTACLENRNADHWHHMHKKCSFSDPAAPITILG